MPSPFPGMDPFLEDPGLWPDVHHRLITIASDLLADRLRPKYYVRIEERVYISDEDDPGRSVIAPDIRVAARAGWEQHPLGAGEAEAARVKVAEPVENVVLLDEEIHEARLEIVDRDGHRVVTVIEVVSPANKVPKSDGRASFERKRREVMGSETHWVAIDLLRGGERVRTRRRLPPHEYLVHVSRAERYPRGQFWPIRLSQRLPVILIPLKPEDPDAPLDLQAVLATTYDRAGYDLSVEYTREPVPPLAGEWSAWSDALLKAHGLRPA
jgi:hypothetical protein